MYGTDALVSKIVLIHLFISDQWGPVTVGGPGSLNPLNTLLLRHCKTRAHSSIMVLRSKYSLHSLKSYNDCILASRCTIFDYNIPRRELLSSLRGCQFSVSVRGRPCVPDAHFLSPDAQIWICRRPWTQCENGWTHENNSDASNEKKIVLGLQTFYQIIMTIMYTVDIITIKKTWWV